MGISAGQATEYLRYGKRSSHIVTANQERLSIESKSDDETNTSSADPPLRIGALAGLVDGRENLR
jgi:hypothetical protein